MDIPSRHPGPQLPNPTHPPTPPGLDVRLVPGRSQVPLRRRPGDARLPGSPAAAAHGAAARDAGALAAAAWAADAWHCQELGAPRWDAVAAGVVGGLMVGELMVVGVGWWLMVVDCGVVNLGV